MTDLPTDLPPPEENLPPPPDTDAGTWDIMGAAWQAETIRTDAWNYTQGKRRELATSMYDMLAPDAKERIQAKRWDYENNWIDFEDLVLGEVAREVPANPTKYGDLPLSREQFDLRIDGERRAEFDEAQAILDQPGGGLAEFVGSSARAMTDRTSLMLMPFGVGGSAWRTILGEAFLGAVGEAAVLPREYQVAEDLDLETPDALSRIGMGAVLGGGISAGLIGLVKGGGRVLAYRRALRDAKPAGADALPFEAEVEAAEAQLRGDPTVTETVGPKQTAQIDAPAGPVQFDYRPTGKPTRIGRDVANIVRSNTPFLSSAWPLRTAYSRLVADELQAFLDPEADILFRRKVKQMARDYGTQPFVPYRGSGQTLRAPDLGNAFGGRE